ncbi:MAG TPA: helix-turn-helix transcriptional regulator [Jatrophihabitantaceae bacterium]
MQRAIGAAVRDARDGAGLRQEDLGDLIGLSQDAIARLEKGERRVSLVTLGRIESALGRPFGSFTREVGLVELPASIRDQLEVDPELDDEARAVVKTVYDYAAAASARSRH